jgi:mRNA interferase MazF
MRLCGPRTSITVSTGPNGSGDLPRRFEVWLVSLDPTRGSEVRKTRPCVIVSPDEMNRHIRTVIVAPMTIAGRRYPTRVAVAFEEKEGQIALDQLRAVDKARLVRHLGLISRPTAAKVCTALIEMFKED